MYRYSVDNAVTYTPDDFVLFRESPFAVWMERLTLENPDHGILPDLNSTVPGQTAEQNGDIVETLRAEGRDVLVVDWDLDEAERRAATLTAMRDGADFIVNGQLALGPLSGSANLLMRTSGYSELGNFLYVPCDTQTKTTLHSAYRLCFLADLLHSLQGQLPPQMLIIRGEGDVVPLQTDDHIFYYRAVKKRFMDDMRNFRKHRMPDPTESSHFGRWSECASEVLKQRAHGEGSKQDNAEEYDSPQPENAQPELQVASSAGQAMPAYGVDMDTPAVPEQITATVTALSGAGQTLLEQARQLGPGGIPVGVGPGRTPNLAAFGVPRPVPSGHESPNPAHSRRSTDVALENLEFIGSSADSDTAVDTNTEDGEAPLQPLPAHESPGNLVGVPLEPVAIEETDSVETDSVEIESVETATIQTDSLEASAGIEEVAAQVSLEDEVVAEHETAEAFLQEPGEAPREYPMPEVTEPPPPHALDALDEPEDPWQSSEELDELDELDELSKSYLLPPEGEPEEDEPPEMSLPETASRPDPLDSDGFDSDTILPEVDLDSAPPPSLAPVVTSADQDVPEDFEVEESVVTEMKRSIDWPFVKSAPVYSEGGVDADEPAPPTRPISSSLITSDDPEIGSDDPEEE